MARILASCSKDRSPLLDQFLTDLQNKGYSVHTLCAYERTLQEFLGQFSAIQATTAETITTFLDRLYERKNAVTSIARALSCLRTFFNFCQAKGLIEENPAREVDYPEVRKKLPEVRSSKQINALIDQVGTVSEYKEQWLDARDRLIFEILYGCGLTVSEIVALNRDDIDLHQRQILVRQRNGITGRILSFDQEVDAALSRYFRLVNPHEALLLNHRSERLSTRSVGRIVKRHAKRFLDDNKLHPYSLRHYFGMLLAEQGVDILRIRDHLGHVTVSSAQLYALRKFYNKVVKIKQTKVGKPKLTHEEIEKLRSWRKDMRRLQREGKLPAPRRMKQSDVKSIYGEALK